MKLSNLSPGNINFNGQPITQIRIVAKIADKQSEDIYNLIELLKQSKNNLINYSIIRNENEVIGRFEAGLNEMPPLDALFIANLNINENLRGTKTSKSVIELLKKFVVDLAKENDINKISWVADKNNPYHVVKLYQKLGGSIFDEGEKFCKFLAILNPHKKSKEVVELVQTPSLALVNKINFTSLS